MVPQNNVSTATKPFFGTQDVAYILDMTAPGVTALIRQGKIPAEKVGNKKTSSYVIPVEAVREIAFARANRFNELINGDN